MRKKARERLKDFGLDDNGKMAYLGDHVRLVDGSSRRSLLVALWTAGGLAVAAAVGASLVNPEGLSGCPYVVMPYMVQLVALVSVVWALGRFSVAGKRVRAYVRDETVGALPLRTLVSLVLALVATVGELVFLALTDATLGAPELVFLALEVMCVVALVVLRRICLDVEWESA